MSFGSVKYKSRVSHRMQDPDHFAKHIQWLKLVVVLLRKRKWLFLGPN